MTPALTASVVVASYRQPERLARCLAGLRAQTTSPDEVVVVVQERDTATLDTVRDLADAWPRVRTVTTAAQGSVAAYNVGLAAAAGAIVAYLDDDAVPEADWLERIVATFSRDERIAAVGGRDVIPGQASADAGLTVGRLRWFGRMVNNHHLGAGEAREADFLKGANMAFRRLAIAGHGFDRRLRGAGAQVHAELSVCLPLRRRGLRVIYDPAIRVRHEPAARPAGDVREMFDAGRVTDATHNETVAVLDHLATAYRPIYALWAVLVGSTESPGILACARDVRRGRRPAFVRLAAAQRGRWLGWRTHRSRPRAVLPSGIHLVLTNQGGFSPSLQRGGESP